MIDLVTISRLEVEIEVLVVHQEDLQSTSTKKVPTKMYFSNLF